MTIASAPPQPARGRRRARRTWLVALSLAVAALSAAYISSVEVRYVALRALSRLDDGVAALSTKSWTANAGDEPLESRLFFHRARVSPELSGNSPAALARADAERRPIEFDVAFTSDGVAYVSHDNDLGGPALSELSEADYLNLVSKGRLTARSRLTGNVHRLLSQPPASYVFDLKPDRHREAAAADIVLRDIPEPYLRGSTFISRSGRMLLHLARSGRVDNLGCESFSPLANRLSAMNWYSHDLRTLSPWSDRLARSLGLKRVYWVVRGHEDWERARASRPDILLIDPAAGNPL